jgi:predicted secreted protein
VFGLPTAGYAGFNGQIYMSTDGQNYVSLGETRDATLTINQEDIDATSYDSNGWKVNIVGFKSWEMTTESIYLSANNAGQLAVFNSLVAGATLFWRFLPKTGDNRRGYEGQGFVTSFEVSVPVDDVVSLSLSIMGTEQLAPYNTGA